MLDQRVICGGGKSSSPSSPSPLIDEKDVENTVQDVLKAAVVVDTPPSMAQTYMRGPLTPTGSGKPLTAEELAACREELEAIKKDTLDQVVSNQPCGCLGEEGIKWRFGGAPDYSLTNLKYLQARGGKTKNHAEGSLELIVENLVKTWEMDCWRPRERSHKVDPDQHRSVDPEKFHVGANGWKKFTGSYEGNRGQGELLEMFGFGVATVDEQLRQDLGGPGSLRGASWEPPLGGPLDGRHWWSGWWMWRSSTSQRPSLRPWPGVGQ
eukprot:Skav218496  [mRNA]  locus=scaffold3758:6983:13301:+ [translate_table: standard]